MGVVETDQPGAVRTVQRERIVQAVRSRWARLDAPDLELDPVAPFKMMDSSVERQQELKVVLVRAVFHIISCHDMSKPESGHFQRRQVHGGRVPGGGVSFRDIGITAMRRDGPRCAQGCILDDDGRRPRPCQAHSSPFVFPVAEAN